MACGVCETTPDIAKWLYFTGFVITAVVSWVLREHGHAALGYIGAMDACMTASTDPSVQNVCYGKGAVLRLSFGNFIFFACHSILLLGVKRQSDGRRVVHTGCWGLQVLAWAALLGFPFALPNSVFNVYGQIARVFAGIFLVFVIIIILDWFFMLNEWLLQRDSACSRVTLITGSLLFYVGSIVALGFLYSWFAPRASCSLNIFWLTFTLLGAVAYTAISLSPWRVKSAGLLTSGAVFVYCVFLAGSALNSEPSNSCAPTDRGSETLQILGFLFAIAMVLVSTIDAGVQSKAFDLERQKEEAHWDELPYRPDFFHFIFTLASAYLAMVFTGWNLEGTPGAWSTGQSLVSTWIKIGAQWLCMLLYLWILLAPRILKQREFA